MPIYEYHCCQCRTTFNFLVRNISAHKKPACPKCKKKRGMERRISRFAMSRASKGKESAGSGGALDDAADMAGMPDLAGLDENDPKSLGRFMRKMAQETGEDLGPEFDEVCARLEAGEDPEKIEEQLGDVLGDGGPGESYDDTLYEA